MGLPTEGRPAVVQVDGAKRPIRIDLVERSTPTREQATRLDMLGLAPAEAV